MALARAEGYLSGRMFNAERFFSSFFFPPADGSAERQSEGNRILMKNERSGNFIPGREKKEEHVKVKCTHGFAFSPLVCGEAGCCPLPAT